MAKEQTDRTPYVAVPRDLASHETWKALSRDAQWLLQHLERDPYRLKSGVFVLNERLIAREAKADVTEVAAWWAELVDHGWLIEDHDTGEAWLTMHMTWDNTLSNRNHAVAVLRDIRRVSSQPLVTMIERLVYARHPQLDPSHGIDPAWTDENPADTGEQGHADAIGNGTPNGIAGTTPNSQARIPNPRTPEPVPQPPEHGTQPPKPQPAARSTGGAPCEKCDDLGIVATNGRVGYCTCAKGTAEASKVVSIERGTA